METIVAWIVGVLAIVTFFFRVSRFSSWRPWRRHDETDDGFGNFAEQRFLEEDHPVTMSGPNHGAQVANTREAREKGLGYW